MSTVVQLTQPANRLEHLAAEWMSAKAAEKQANTDRLAVEQQLLAIIDELPEEGTTHQAAGAFVVTVQTKLTRALDASKLLGLADRIPEHVLRRLVSYEPKLNLRELRYVQDNEPAFYKAFAAALTVKPAKAAVSVEPVEEVA